MLEREILKTKLNYSGAVDSNFFTTKNNSVIFFPPIDRIAFFKIPSPTNLCLLSNNYVVYWTEQGAWKKGIARPLHTPYSHNF
jgi:hypothetical protein